MRRILPTICVHSCRVARVSCQAGYSSFGQRGLVRSGIVVSVVLQCGTLPLGCRDSSLKGFRMHRATYLAAALVSIICVAGVAVPANRAPAMAMDPTAAARFAGLALKCLHEEYPNHISHSMDGDADALPPHVLTPAFYGCLDWHSDVHGHWLLVRLLRLMPDAPFAQEARAELGRSLTPKNIAGEVVYLHDGDRAPF